MFKASQEIHRRLQWIPEMLSQEDAANPKNAFATQKTQAHPSTEAGSASAQRPPGWLRYAAVILMLPVGFIFLTLIFLIFNLTSAGPHYPEEVLVIFSLVILVFFIARLLLWRRHLGQIWENERAL